MACPSPGIGRRLRWPISQVHGPVERHVSHLQCTAPRSDTRFSHGWRSEAQRGDRGVRSQLGLVDALLQAYRVRPAWAENVQLASTAERPMKLHEPFAGGTLPRLDRIIVAGLLLLVAALAWAFTVHQAIRMDEMEVAMWRDMNMSMNGMEPSWNAVDAVVVFVMWSAIRSIDWFSFRSIWMPMSSSPGTL